MHRKCINFIKYQTIIASVTWPGVGQGYEGRMGEGKQVSKQLV